MNELLPYFHKTETTESLITLCIYDTPLDTAITFFQGQLDKSHKISNPVKKSRIQSRIASLLKYWTDIYGADGSGISLHSIFLLDDSLKEIPLTEEQCAISRTYSMPPLFIKMTTTFYASYLWDFFTNFKFIYSIKVTKTNAELMEFNQHKERLLEKRTCASEGDIAELLAPYKGSPVILWGAFTFPYKGGANTIIRRGETDMNRQKLYALFQKQEMEKNHALLKKRLDDLQNPKTNLDLYLFGKLKMEIKDAVENYLLKELYIESSRLEKLKNCVDSCVLNFTIIPIDSLEEGDVASTFIRDYNGLMGIKYF